MKIETYSVYDNHLDEERLAVLDAAWPDPSWEGWLRYDSPLEKKRTCHCWSSLPPPLYQALTKMVTCQSFRAIPYWMSEGDAIVADPGLCGGGLHSMQAGDYLDIHLDSDQHPFLKRRRRVNAILFCHARWESAWGGKLELWDNLEGEPVKIEPVPGRLVLFKTSDSAYHGVPRPLTCPPGVTRKSLACYFWGKEIEVAKRPRALFVPLPGETPDPVKQALRQKRAEPREDCQA